MLPLRVPEALKLPVKPAANCERYNQRLQVRPTTIVLLLIQLRGMTVKGKLFERMKVPRLRGMANALEDSLTALSQRKLAPT